MRSFSDRFNPYGQRWTYVLRCYARFGLFIAVAILRWVLIILFIGLVYSLTGNK